MVGTVRTHTTAEEDDDDDVPDLVESFDTAGEPAAETPAETKADGLEDLN